MPDNNYFNPRYSHARYLKAKAAKRMPRFAFDYLEGGIIDERGLAANLRWLDEIELGGSLLNRRCEPNLSIELFGKSYAYPFGIAPVGLQGLMWPRAPEILAGAAASLKIPYVLSTVSSASLERIAEIGQGYAWFQFYNPTDDSVRQDLLNRLQAAGYQELMITVDVPTFGYRPKDIRNGLAMPPKMSIRNILQMLARPSWLAATAQAGKPQMETLLPYIPANTPTDQLREFMNKSVMGPVDSNSLKIIRDKWPGKIMLKGINSIEDARIAADIGMDGVVISNHGGRQLDAGASHIASLKAITESVGDRIEVLFDSGLYSGTDLAKVLACGARMGFFGRLFVYGAAALGNMGGLHTGNMIALQLLQVAKQLGCKTPADFQHFLL